MSYCRDNCLQHCSPCKIGNQLIYNNPVGCEYHTNMEPTNKKNSCGCKRKNRRKNRSRKYCNVCRSNNCKCIEYYSCLRVKHGYICATLTKFATPNFYVEAGQTITYSYIITNTGNVPICYPIQICDDVLGTWFIPHSYILPYTSQVFTRNYTITTENLGEQSITNSAVAYIQVKRRKWVCVQAQSLTTITFGNANVSPYTITGATGNNFVINQIPTIEINLFLPHPTGVYEINIGDATPITITAPPEINSVTPITAPVAIPINSITTPIITLTIPSTITSETDPSDTISPETTPSETILSDTISPETTLSETILSDTIPFATIPPDENFEITERNISESIKPGDFATIPTETTYIYNFIYEPLQ